MTSLLTEGLVTRGHEVTLFATAESRTSARLHATFPRGYGQDPTLWPWELCEMFNLAAAVERADQFDIIHYEAMYYPMSLAFSRLANIPIVQTLHHAPSQAEIALWCHYPDAPFIAISDEQAALLGGVNVVGTVPARHRHRPLRVPRRPRTTTCCSSAASPKARECRRRSRWRGGSA